MEPTEAGTDYATQEAERSKARLERGPCTRCDHGEGEHSILTGACLRFINTANVRCDCAAYAPRYFNAVRAA